MRNPGRKVLIWLLISMLAVGALVIGFKPSQSIDSDWPSTALATFGVLALPFGAVSAVWALLLWLGQRRLLAGHRLLASWHVSREEWRKFITIDRIRVEASIDFFGDYNVSKQQSDRGVDVVVGETGIAIGDFYQTLRRGGLPGLTALYWLPAPAEPQCLEFHVVYPRKYGGSRLCVRAPITRTAHDDALRVYHYFEPLLRPKTALALRNPSRTIGIALVVAFLCTLAAAWGYSNRGPSEIQVYALSAAVVGTIVGPAALILALATWLLARRRSG